MMFSGWRRGHDGFVSGHGFSLALAQYCSVRAKAIVGGRPVSGHGFSRAKTWWKGITALAAEPQGLKPRSIRAPARGTAEALLKPCPDTKHPGLSEQHRGFSR